MRQKRRKESHSSLQTKSKEELTELVADLQLQLEALETRNQRALKELEKKERYYRSLLFNMHEDILVIDRDYTVTDVNKSALTSIGQKREEVIGQKCYTVSHGYNETCHTSGEECPLEQVFQTGRAGACVHDHTRADGSRSRVSIIMSPMMDENGNITRVVESVRDVTELVSAREQLEQSLEEKQILLREIHHRVKNNMAVISSLLNLQSAPFDDPKVKSAFKDCQHRIRSMALVHEKLYQSGDLAHIDFPGYIRELIKRLYHSTDFGPTEVDVEIEAEDISLGIDIAIPCALLITELASNALKHAFTNRSKGQLHIAMTVKDEGYYQLVVRDNGVGLPLDFDLEHPTSFGIELVQLLTQQLDGRIEVKDNHGTMFTIVFPC